MQIGRFLVWTAQDSSLSSLKRQLSKKKEKDVNTDAENDDPEFLIVHTRPSKIPTPTPPINSPVNISPDYDPVLSDPSNQTTPPTVPPSPSILVNISPNPTEATNDDSTPNPPLIDIPDILPTVHTPVLPSDDDVYFSIVDIPTNSQPPESPDTSLINP